MQAIDEAIERCKAIEDQAVCIVLDSVKGQGVPFFEELDANHSVKFITDEINQAAEAAIKELTIKIEGGR